MEFEKVTRAKISRIESNQRDVCSEFDGWKQEHDRLIEMVEHDEDVRHEWATKESDTAKQLKVLKEVHDAELVKYRALSVDAFNAQQVQEALTSLKSANTTWGDALRLFALV